MNPERKYVYKKRSGTSGVTGQLFETKLLSLILHRALRDEDVTQFYLGTNLDDIGAFDDICIKFKFDNKWTVAFIQAKHRDEPRKGGITDRDLTSEKSDFNIKKYFESYMKIMQKFENFDKNDIIFTDDLKNIECCLIIYTPAISKITKKKYTHQNMLKNKVSELISTCDDDDVFQIKYDDCDVSVLANILIEEQLHLISKALINSIVTDKTQEISDHYSEVIKKFSSFLTSSIIVPCQEKQDEWIINDKILYTNVSLNIKFREILSNEILKLRANEYSEKEISGKLAMLTMYNYFDVKYLIELIGSFVIYNTKTKKLDLIEKVPKKLELFRENVKNLAIPQSVINEALYEAGKNVLLSVRFKLSCVVGNLKNNVSEIESSGTPSLIDTLFYEQKNIARQFYDKLLFYTNEAKQDRVETKLKNELKKQTRNRRETEMNVYRIHSEAVFLKFHDKVQKWSMLQGNVSYLTKNCGFLEKSKNEIVNKPFLTTLNYNCLKEFSKYSIRFKNKTMESFKLQLDSSTKNVINIVTNVNLLTGMKLIQHFETGENNCSFMNFEFVVNLSNDELELLMEEIQSTESIVLVIFIKDVFGDIYYNYLNSILNVFKKKLIFVTDSHEQSSNIKTQFDQFHDKEIHFMDLSEECQKILLAGCKITVQGLQVSMEKIIDDKCKRFIDDELLYMLLKNQNVIIGNDLTDDKYEKIQELYIPRTITNEKFEYEVKNLKDIVKSVVVITAEPGMGKSTFLTHLSLETKIACPDVWVARINLLDHCAEFMKWKNEKKGITLEETMTLVCKTEFNNREENFELQVLEGVLTVKNCDMKGPALLQLMLIIHGYNTGSMIFIFDGFDEICPHYEKEVIQLIKNVVPELDDINKLVNSEDDNPLYEIKLYLPPLDVIYHEKALLVQPWHIEMFRKRKQVKVWIASRPYNSITQTLKNEFGTLYRLRPWSSNDQKIYCHNYFESTMKLDEMNTDQFRNIESFFEFMAQFRRNYRDDYKVMLVTNIPLQTVYEFAVDYFRNAILQTSLESLDVDKERLRNNWVSRTKLVTVTERCFGEWSKMDKAIKLASIPLHIYIAANYFVNIVLRLSDHRKAIEKWDISVNTFEYYEKFLETKFKNIRLEEKNRRYTSCPDEIIAYEKEKKEFVNTHKKLAFFAIFHHNDKYIKKILPKKEQTAINKLIEQIEKGEDKNGLIHRIHNNVPRFIHQVFAEYFAVEYISDKLKCVNKTWKRKWLDFIVNYLFWSGSEGVRTIFDHKLKHDKELIKALSGYDAKKTVLKLLLAQNEEMEWAVDNMMDDPYERKMESSLHKSITLRNNLMFLLSSIDIFLNVNNLQTFIELIGKDFFVSIVICGLDDDVILYVINKLRTFDPKILTKVLNRSELLPYYLRVKLLSLSNDEILKKIHEEAERLTTPLWYYDPYRHDYLPYNF